MKNSSKKPLLNYVIPISGLHAGLHTYEYVVEKEFFEHFELSIINNGTVKVQLELDKQSSMYELNFELSGFIQTECDRCLEALEMEIESAERVLVKFGKAELDDAEVIYITPDTETLDVSPLVYQFIHLAVPMVKTHESVGQECPVNINNYLKSEEEASKNTTDLSVWDALKDLNIESE